jgi:hypothetical protein
MRFALVYAAAALLTVFDDCGNIGAPPPPPPKPPTLPYCSTDPPQGCAVVCTDVGLPPVADDCCMNPANDTRTVQFLAAVQTWEDQQEASAEAAGEDFTFCPESAIGKGASPCTLGIPPILWPANQALDSCTPPPSGCSAGCSQ